MEPSPGPDGDRAPTETTETTEYAAGREPPRPRTDHRITSCETRPGRVVFTHSDDADAWIATDLVVTPEP